MAHARLSPSSAHRWTRCPASPARESKYRDLAGYEAAEGTAFHHFAELALTEGKDPEAYIGQKVKQSWSEDGKRKTGEIEFTEEMAGHMWPGLRQVRQWMEDDTMEMHVEQRVDISSFLGEKAFGTADIVFVGGMHLIVADWKYGAGVPVAPQENKQLLLYALGAWNKFATKEMREAPDRVTVELHIFQPRCPGGGGGWMLSGEKLLEYGEEFAEAAERTRSADAEAIPGIEQCKFCAVARAGECKERDAFLLEMASSAFDDLEAEELETSDPRGIDLELRSKLVRHKNMIVAWLDELHKATVEDALAGRPTPGLRLAKGRRGPRHIPVSVQPEAMEVAELLLGSEAFVRKLDSLGRLEKKFGKDQVLLALGEFIRQSDPKPILVPEDDEKHEPWPLPADHFNDDDVEL